MVCLFYFWLSNLTRNDFSRTSIMENHSHLIKILKCEQCIKFWKVVEHCGLLAQVSKAGLANVCNRGFYSTYLTPKSGKCRKNKLSQILPDIPYQTSMKPQHISPPSLARSSAAKLVRGKGTSTKTHSNKLLVYIWWINLFWYQLWCVRSCRTWPINWVWNECIEG